VRGKARQARTRRRQQAVEGSVVYESIVSESVVSEEFVPEGVVFTELWIGGEASAAGRYPEIAFTGCGENVDRGPEI
jgi:hypothetical protein